jgi:hypothetical protein
MCFDNQQVDQVVNVTFVIAYLLIAIHNQSGQLNGFIGYVECKMSDA